MPPLNHYQVQVQQALEAERRRAVKAELERMSVSLPDVLRALPQVLTRLVHALDAAKKPQREPIPRLAFRKSSVAKMCDLSTRTIDRLIASGRFPRPAAHAGRCPLWECGQIIGWIANGGSKEE